ncbi:MAG: hypothetical protein ACOY0T_31130 [Myxococcota bacterium]
MIVQNRLTPLDRDAAANALIIAYQRITGALPSEKVATLLLAQSALETGHWKSIHNYNFGNIKAGAGYPIIVQFRCSEVENGVETFYDPPDPHCNFRAYETAADGAVDYLKVLQSRPHWWKGLHSEDPNAFVDALASPPKYFTANPERYKTALVSLYRQFLPLVQTALHRIRRPHLVPVQVPAPANQEPPSVSCSEFSQSQAQSLSARCSDRAVAPESTSTRQAERATVPATVKAAQTPSSWVRVLLAVVRWLGRLFRRDGGTP